MEKNKEINFWILAFTLCAISITFYACNDNTTGNPTPGPSAVSDRDQAALDYNNLYLPASITLEELAWTGNTGGCNEGTVSSLTLDRSLARINYFRKICGLPNDMVWNESWHNPSQKIALMCHKNNSLSHTPPSSWKCYTDEGAAAGAKTNLILGQFGSESINGWVHDAGANNRAVGHRRWILFSRAKEYGFGSTSGAAALYCVAHTSDPVEPSIPEYIAYPPKYIPQSLVYPRWSLGVVNPNSFFSGVDFQNAVVLMAGPTGEAITLTIVSKNDNGIADQTLVWEPIGINTTSAEDLTYHVIISNVKLNGVDKTYDYYVTIFKP